MITASGGKAPALAFSFPVTEQDPRTEPTPFILYWQKAKDPYCPEAWLRPFHEVITAVLKQSRALRDVVAQRTERKKKKRLCIFSTPPEAQQGKQASCTAVMPSTLTLTRTQACSYGKDTDSKPRVCHVEVIRIKLSFASCGFCCFYRWVIHIHL